MGGLAAARHGLWHGRWECEGGQQNRPPTHKQRSLVAIDRGYGECRGPIWLPSQLKKEQRAAGRARRRRLRLEAAPMPACGPSAAPTSLPGTFEAAGCRWGPAQAPQPACLPREPTWCWPEAEPPRPMAAAPVLERCKLLRGRCRCSGSEERGFPGCWARWAASEHCWSNCEDAWCDSNAWQPPAAGPVLMRSRHQVAGRVSPVFAPMCVSTRCAV